MPYQLGDTPMTVRTIPILGDFVNANRVNYDDKWRVNKVNNGRGSWTRTNECQDQNLVPYQLGDTPV